MAAAMAVGLTAPAYAETELTMYYPIAVGGALTEVVDGKPDITRLPAGTDEISQVELEKVVPGDDQEVFLDLLLVFLHELLHLLLTRLLLTDSITRIRPTLRSTRKGGRQEGQTARRLVFPYMLSVSPQL